MTTATYAPTASAVTAAPQLAPYGFFGDLAKTFAPVAGQAIGGIFGNSNVGGQIGNAVGHLAGFLPFSAGPMVPQTVVPHPALVQPQLAPYGFFGDLIKTIAPTAGQALGGVFGNSGIGGQIGNTVGQIASFLPFSAGPAIPQAVPQQLVQQPQLAPYGFFGGALGNVLGGLGGGALGDLFGNKQLGSTIGTTAGTILGSILPFSAQPMVPFAQTPYVQYTN